MTERTPAVCCRRPLAHRRHHLAQGAPSEEGALQPAYELVCGWFAGRDCSPRRFLDSLEDRVLSAREGHVAVACSAILGARRDPHRRGWRARWVGEGAA